MHEHRIKKKRIGGLPFMQITNVLSHGHIFDFTRIRELDNCEAITIIIDASSHELT